MATIEHSGGTSKVKAVNDKLVEKQVKNSTGDKSGSTGAAVSVSKGSPGSVSSGGGVSSGGSYGGTNNMATPTQSGAGSSYGGGSAGGGTSALYGDSGGAYGNGSVYKVGADGKAPAGLSVGSDVVTAGGTYRITGINSDGSYQSTKINNVNTNTYSGIYANEPYGGAQGLNLWAPGGINGSDGQGGFAADAKGDFLDADGNSYSHLFWDLLTDGTIRNTKTGEVKTYYPGDDRTGKKSVFADVIKAYGENGDLVVFSSPEEITFFNSAPAGATMQLNGATYTKNSDGGVTVLTNGDRRRYSTTLSDGSWSQSDRDKGSGGGGGGSSGGQVSWNTAAAPTGGGQYPAASGQTAGTMPTGWTEYAYDSEGKPFTMATEKAYDFLYNSNAKTMTGANGIVFTRNDDGSVTITEPSGRTSVWRPSGGYSAPSADYSGMTATQKAAALNLSAYDAAYLAPEDQASIAALKQAYQNAKDKGDKEGMQRANDQANAIRAKYGYTGGGDGATLQLLNQQAAQMQNIDLGSYQSALDGLVYTPMRQGKDWSAGLEPYDPLEAEMAYSPLAAQYQGQTMDQTILPTYQSAYNGLSAPVLSGQESEMGNVRLGDYNSALNGLNYQAMAGNGEPVLGNINLRDYNSVLNGIAYQPMAGQGEAELGNINLRNYNSALAGMQYTPQGSVQEAELALTQLPAYQAAYGSIQTPTLTGQQAQQMGNAALQSYQAQTDAVNQVYAAQQAAALAALKSAYESSRAEAEHGMGKIAAEYQQQKNEAASENERARQLYNEQAAATGLNAGNRAQAALAFSNQLQNNLGQLGAAQANAMSDAQFELNRLYADYQNQISQAIAQNNYEKAAALLEEYRTAQQSKVDTAIQQANLNLQTADYNRQVTNDRTNALQQEFQNQLAIAQGRQADQQAAAELAAQQAALNLQTAQYNREGRQLQRDAAQQDWQNQLTLAQLQDAAQQDAWNRAYQQAGLDLQVADYNRQGRELNRQAQQQDWQNQLALAQLQDAAQQDAWNRAYQQAGLDLQVADYNRQGRELDRQAAQQDWQNQFALAQAQDTAQQDAWNRAYQQALLDMQTAEYNREGRNINTQNQQQAFENQLALANAQDAANQSAFNQALQQANLNLQTADYNRQANDSYLNALQQDFQNRLALNQNQQDAYSMAYNQAYQKAQLGLQNQSLNNDILQQNWQNELAFAQAQDAAQQAAWNQALQQAGLDLDIWDRNRQAEQDMIAQQQQMFDNQRALRNEQYQQNVFDWQQQQDILQRQDQLAQAERDAAQQKWANEFALTELGAKYNDFNRLAYYGYTPEQIQNMYRFAQMDALGYTW